MNDFDTGMIAGSLITGVVATMLWLLRNRVQGRINKLPVNEDWPEGGPR